MILTNSIINYGKDKYYSEAKDLVPAVIIVCGEDKYIILAPNYKNLEVRYILDLLHGLSLEDNDKSEYVKRMNNILNGDKIPTIDSELRKTIISDTRSSMVVGISQEYSEALITLLEMLMDLNCIVSDYDESFTEESEYSELSFLASNPEKFENDVKKLSGKNECLYVGDDRVLYPEDLFFDQQTEFKAFKAGVENIYNEYSTIDTVLDKLGSSEGTRKLINKKHCTCGYELVIRFTKLGYTNMQCLNPYCIHKAAGTIADLATNLGIKGLGEKTIFNLCRPLMNNRILIYGYSDITLEDILDEDLVDYSNTGTLLSNLINTLSEFKDYTSDLIKISGIPYVGETLSKIITKDLLQKAPSDNFRDFCKYFSTFGINSALVLHRLFIQFDNVKTIIDYSSCTDEQSNLPPIYVCITGTLNFNKHGVRLTKQGDYAKFINEMIKERRPDLGRIIPRDNMSMEITVLIKDNNSNSIKTVYARDNNIPINSANEFYEALFEEEKFIARNTL